MHHIHNTDRYAEPLYRTLCYPHFTKVRHVTYSSSASIEEYYGPYRTKEQGSVIYV